MSTIHASLLYADGALLDTSAHNANIYSTSVGAGVMSEANGGLEDTSGSTNLQSGFSVEAEHIQSGQAVGFAQESYLYTRDCFQDAYGRTDSTQYTESNAPDDVWSPIVGIGVRFYVPFATSVVLLQWSTFINVYHVRRFEDSDETTLANSEVSIGAKYDGVLIDHTIRPLPVTIIYRRISSSNHYGPDSAHACMSWDMQHLVQNVSPGWHHLQLCLFIERISEVVAVNLVRGDAAAADYSMNANQRATFGISNARMMRLL